MSLHMLQFAPDMPALIRWAEERRLLAAGQDDDLGYACHAVLRAAFDTLAPAPFALVRSQSRPPQILAYCAQPGEALREQAMAFAEPEVVRLLGVATMAAKPMPEHFAVGRRLGFTVRARPVVRTDANGDRRRTRERDAFLAAVTRTEVGKGPSRGAVYQAWLSQRLTAGGAEAEHVVLDSFRLSTTVRRDRDRRLRPLCGPDAAFSGVVTITDPDRFSGLLAGGVGRHAAFGFGMLLLRPA